MSTFRSLIVRVTPAGISTCASCSFKDTFQLSRLDLEVTEHPCHTSAVLISSTLFPCTVNEIPLCVCSDCCRIFVFVAERSATEVTFIYPRFSWIVRFMASVLHSDGPQSPADWGLLRKLALFGKMDFSTENNWWRWRVSAFLRWRKISFVEWRKTLFLFLICYNEIELIDKPSFGPKWVMHELTIMHCVCKKC